jgi:hypothetical protein
MTWLPEFVALISRPCKIRIVALTYKKDPLKCLLQTHGALTHQHAPILYSIAALRTRQPVNLVAVACLMTPC